MPRQNAKQQRSQRTRSQSQCSGRGQLRSEGPIISFRVRMAGVHGDQQAQVVEAGQAGVQQAHNGEGGVAPGDGGREDVELAEEAAGEGNATPVKSSMVRVCSA